jgi:uncharacterized membrane protein
MRWIICVLLSALVIGSAANARQIAGKTNKGSFLPILRISTELSFPSSRDTMKAGEQGTIKIVITNIGGSAAVGVTAKMSPGSALSGVKISPEVKIGNVTPGNSGSVVVPVEALKSAASQKVDLSILASTTSGIKSDLQSISFFVT